MLNIFQVLFYQISVIIIYNYYSYKKFYKNFKVFIICQCREINEINKRLKIEKLNFIRKENIISIFI